MAYDRRQGEAHEPLEPAGGRIEYLVEAGRAYVPVGVERGFVILDPSRAATLRAWASTLIPASGALPAAGDIGAVEYIDATAFAAPRLRTMLLRGIDTVERIVMARYERSLGECTPEQRVTVLREFEIVDTSDVFNMIRDFTYEAYYGNDHVLDPLEQATGWRYQVSVTGTVMGDFDERLLEPMRAITPRYREA